MKIKTGNPKSFVTIWTPDTVYELHSDMANAKESEIISISVSKSLSSVSGSFSIDFVPRPDAQGKLWSEKLHAFDYVEIKLRGGGDDKEKIVCRGLIDTVTVSENYGSGVPRRLIRAAGRDLGALLTDFNIAYIVGYEPWANVLKVYAWKGNLKERPYVNAQEAFDLIMGKWKEIVDLTVGNIVSNASNEKTEAPTIVPRSLNLTTKISYKARAFFPDMKTTFNHLTTFEGSILNAVEVYRDKPWHELLLYEGEETSVFVLRPANLKDAKGNLPLEVKNLQDSKAGSVFYQKDLKISSEDIVSQEFSTDLSTMSNYFFTMPKLAPIYGSDWLSVACGMNPNKPWASVNPWLAVKWENNPNNPEPVGYIGRYGLRPKPLYSNFIGKADSCGQLSSKAAKESGGNPDQSSKDASKNSSEDYVKPSSTNTVGLQKIPQQLSTYDAYVQKSATKNSMEPAAVYAMMTCENAPGNPNQPTPADKGASTSWGLMQINDAPTRGHDVAWVNKKLATNSNGSPKWTDPESNIEYGTSLFKDYYNQFTTDPHTGLPYTHDQKLKYAADAYATGVRNVKKAIANKTWPNYPFLSDKSQYQLDKHQKNFDASYGKYTGSLGTASSAANAGIVATPVVDSEGKKVIREQIKDEFGLFGIRLNQILVAWFLHNHLLRNGALTIRGTNNIKVGTYVTILEDAIQGKQRKNYEYYIENVVHSFTLFEGYTVQLQLSRGQPTKELGGLVGERDFFGKDIVLPFYFDTTRTVAEAARTIYEKISEEKKQITQTDAKNVPVVDDKIHPEK